MKKYFILLFGVLVILQIIGCADIEGRDTYRPKVEKGILTLSSWDFIAAGNISLDGDWEFYWNQLLAPGDFNNSDIEMTGYYPVPFYWTKYQGLNLPARGMATYRVVIDNDKIYKSLSIKTPEIYTEYCLWVNGKIVDSNGSFNGNKPRYLRPDVYTFSNETRRIEIVLQIKNQAHSNAGIGQSIILGTPENIYKVRIKGLAVDLILFAFCIFAACHNLILFLYKKTNPEFICFAIFTMAVALRGIMSNETFIMQLIPNLPFIVASRIITVSVPLIIISGILYTYFIFRREMSGKALGIILSLSLLYICIVLATPSYFYAAQFNNYLICVASGCLLGIYAAVRSILKGNRESYIFLVGVAFVTIGAFNDMLYFNQKINTGYYLSLGLVMFIIAQSIMLSFRFSRESIEKELLGQKLAESDWAFMRAQIKPHFIYNALSIIVNMITKNPPEAKELLLDFSDYLRSCFNFEKSNGMTTLNEEMEFVRAYLSIEKARFGDRLKVEYALQANPYALIPMLSIQPLVENAVQHGLMEKKEGGTLKIETWDENGLTRIRISDNGAGMDADTLAGLLEEKSRGGVGLKNVNQRLIMKYGTGLTISSQVDEGTSVEMFLPGQ